MLFSWALIAPLFARDANSNLPACCRRNGKHHCMMRMMQPVSGDQKSFKSVSEKCPCFPPSICAVSSPTYKPEAVEQFCTEVVCHPSCAPQAEALHHISFLHSHQKRGPPFPLA
jgi:hypothetical protein